MTDGTNSSKGETPNPANAGEENQQTSDASNAQAEGSAARILEESKKFKARMLAAEKELNDLKKAKLSEQGEYKKLYEAELAERKKLHDTLLKKEIQSAVTGIAAKAGCHDMDVLMKIGKHELLEMDTETMAVSGTEAFVEEAKKAYPWLFAAPKTPVINATAPHGAGAGMKQKSLKEMSKEEIMAQLKALS